MKKKLLVTGTTFPRWEGDTEPRFVLDLSEALTEYFDVTVLVPATPGAKKNEIMNGVNVERYHYFPIHEWETLCYPGAIVPRIKEKKIRALLVPFLCISLWWNLFKRRNKYDVVHAHWLLPQGIVQSFLKMPYIVTGHGGDVGSLNQGILKKFKIRCLTRAKSITVVSNALKEKVKKMVPDEDVYVISMGCDTSRFGKQYRQENYFNQNGKKVVLYVGRLAEKKGVKYLIEAVDDIDCKLVIVGDGPLREELQNQAKRTKIDVEFLGSKTHDELKVIYASADIFVAPSITAKDGDVEGVPTAIMEAMASGLPIIASDSGGISELIKDGENGILTEEKNISQLSENIKLILDNEELAKQFAKEASVSSKQIDYTELAKKYADLIMKCVNN